MPSDDENKETADAKTGANADAAATDAANTTDAAAAAAPVAAAPVASDKDASDKDDDDKDKDDKDDKKGDQAGVDNEEKPEIVEIAPSSAAASAVASPVHKAAKQANPVTGLLSRALKAANAPGNVPGAATRKAPATAEAQRVEITPRKDLNGGSSVRGSHGVLRQSGDLGRNLLLAARLRSGEATRKRSPAPRISRQAPLLTPRGGAKKRLGKVLLSAGPGKVDDDDDDLRVLDDEDEELVSDEEDESAPPPKKRPMRASLLPSKEAQAVSQRSKPLLKAAPGKASREASQRDRKLMGNLMDHLSGARKPPRATPAVRTRRKVTLVGAKSVTKPKLSSALAVAREKEGVKKTILKKASDRDSEESVKEKAPADKEMSAKLKKLEKHFMAMRKFIRTQASPHIFYLPAKPLPATDKLLKESRELMDAKIEALQTHGEVESSDELESDEDAVEVVEASGGEDEYEYEYEEEEEEEEREKEEEQAPPPAKRKR
mmetsp:Transcript_65618/g.137155  ORF Transcript_65618/g.137155 Transcript_65618/m.137155 type:complete len:491 (-) Transcript_65618:214-1686(-)